MNIDAQNRARERADDLIALLCGGELQPSLHGRVRSWLMEAPHGAVVEAALEHWAFHNVVPNRRMPGRAARNGWRRLSETLGLELNELPIRVRLGTSVGQAAMRMAAVVVFALVVTGSALYLRGAMGAGEQLRTLRAEAGEQTFTLPDGTSVKLAAGASLSYPQDFERRDVALDGEAFFDVAGDPDRPFTVSMRNVNLKVLGTAFWVEGHSDRATAQVVLVRGRVEVHAGAESAVMAPGDRMVVDHAQGRIAERTSASHGMLQRIGGGEFNVDNLPAREALRSAADYFGMPAIVGPGVGEGARISLVGHRDMTPEEVVASVNALSDDVAGRVRNDTLMISSR